MTSKVLVAMLGLCSVATVTLPGEAQATTAIPVIFTHTLKAGKDMPDEAIAAKTLQAVVLPSGQQLPKGTVLTGRIMDSRAFAFDPAPYAAQKPSVLSMRFENALVGGQAIPLRLALRALASSQDTTDALTARYQDESDYVGTKTLVGGTAYTANDAAVRSAEHDIVGYVRKDGVHARLLPSTYESPSGTMHCAATSTEQAVGVFSPLACGIYGYDSAYLAGDGIENDGVISIESTHETVLIENGSSAFLQVID
jgi:hypothetical protein